MALAKDLSKQNLNTHPPGLNGGYHSVDTRSSNIIIFGATGVGKSSVINLIAGKILAHTSNKAMGCTFHHQPYDVTLCGIKCRLWDTAGLDEGTEGTVPAAQAESSLKEFIQRMAHAGGINLLIYCIRGRRLTKALRSNYDIFYSGVCRKKVPIALVVTGLENEKSGMDEWWDRNEKTLRHHGMRFDAHACVTTLDFKDDVGMERQRSSQECLHNLIITYSKRPPLRLGESFMSQVFPTLRNLIRRTPSSQYPGSTKRVFVCDMAPPAKSAQFLEGIAAPCLRVSGLVADQEYEFTFVDKDDLDSSTPLDQTGGLLLFYTSPLVDGEIAKADMEKLKKFYDLAGGLTCPVIVVLRGFCASDDTHIEMDTIASSFRDIYAYLTFLPGAADYRPDPMSDIAVMIDRLWIEPVPIKYDPRRF